MAKQIKKPRAAPTHYTTHIGYMMYVLHNEPLAVYKHIGEVRWTVYDTEAFAVGVVLKAGRWSKVQSYMLPAKTLVHVKVAGQD